MPKRGALLVLVSVALVGGCSNEKEEAKRPAPKPQPKPLTLEVRDLSKKVTTNEAITVRGSVTPGARVTVGKKEARVQGGSFRARVRLRVGVNRIRIVAKKTGYVTERKRLRITRREPPPVVQPTQQSSGDTFPCMSDPSYTCSRNGPPVKTPPAQQGPAATEPCLGPGESCSPEENARRGDEEREATERFCARSPAC